jgi:hypothetical protein
VIALFFFFPGIFEVVKDKRCASRRRIVNKEKKHCKITRCGQFNFFNRCYRVDFLKLMHSI